MVAIRDILPMCEQIIAKELRKRLIWKDQRNKGPCRIKIRGIPDVVAFGLFPCLHIGRSVTITKDEELELIFRNVGGPYRDYLKILQRNAKISIVFYIVIGYVCASL